jgi:Protein of unknown function (DUF3551)
MVRILMAATAVLAVMSFGGRPALAYGDHPWCAVYIMGWGDAHWECEYDSIEACRPNILAGNRGFCNPSPYYHGPAKRHAPRHHRHRRN